MPKRPSFQFYPSDWLRDTALRSCSTGARGLWIDMICFMHEGNPYGHLKVKDKVILPDNLARMVGETLEVVEGWLKELHHAGVYDIADDGAICSRRMIRDENLRQIRALGGKLGGNPALMKVDKVNLVDNLGVNYEDKQKTTPSSSSSSSSSKEKNNKNIVPAELPEWLNKTDWNDFVEMRKKLKKPMTDRAVKLMISKLETMKQKGIDTSVVLQKSIMNDWMDVYEPKVQQVSNGMPDWTRDARLK